MDLHFPQCQPDTFADDAFCDYKEIFGKLNIYKLTTGGNEFQSQCDEDNTRSSLSHEQDSVRSRKLMDLQNGEGRNVQHARHVPIHPGDPRAELHDHHQLKLNLVR